MTELEWGRACASVLPPRQPTVTMEPSATAAAASVSTTRRRTKSVSAAASAAARTKKQKPAPVAATHTAVESCGNMDYEALVASLTDDVIMNETAPSTQVNYYTTYQPPQPPAPPPPPPPQEIAQPRLLLRQTYKLANEAELIVGLESSVGYNASVYLVGRQASVKLSYEDILSLRSATIIGTIDKYLNAVNNPTLSTIHLQSIMLEAAPYNNINGGGGGGGGAIAVLNYQIRPRCYNFYQQSQQQQQQQSSMEIIRQSNGVVFTAVGWTYLKRILECAQFYYKVCAECTVQVRNLVERYSRFLTIHYTPRAMLSSARGKDATLIRYISGDLPTMMQSELNSARLPDLPAAAADYGYGDYNEISSPVSTLQPWIDSEVRRYCIANVIDKVFENLAYL